MDWFDVFMLTALSVTVGFFVWLFFIRVDPMPTCAECEPRCAPFVVRECRPLSNSVYCECDTTQRTSP